MPQRRYPQIRVSEDVYDRLAKKGTVVDNFNDVIKYLLDRAEYCECHHEVPEDWREGREGKTGASDRVLAAV